MKTTSVKNIRVNSEVQREMSQIIREDLGSKQFADRRICRITGIGNKHTVSGVEEGEGNVGHAFL